MCCSVHSQDGQQQAETLQRWVVAFSVAIPFLPPVTIVLPFVAS
jgi:hypothetical protein